MRTESPTPWGFDRWDPRLSIRQAAAEAQRGTSLDEPQPQAESVTETVPAETIGDEPEGTADGGSIRASAVSRSAAPGSRSRSRSRS